MTSAGETKEIEVGLHQGSVLSPPLSVIIIDVIREEIEEGTPWAISLADDQVLCDADREMMELRPERWERMYGNETQTTGDVDRLGWRDKWKQRSKGGTDSDGYEKVGMVRARQTKILRQKTSAVLWN